LPVKEERGRSSNDIGLWSLLVPQASPDREQATSAFRPGITDVIVLYGWLQLQMPILPELQVIPVSQEDITPQHIVEDALQSDCLSVSATWTEPTVFFEYVLDTARFARAEGLAICIVSNGNMTPEALNLMLPCIDAANIDLKSFNPEVYRETLDGDLEGVLETLKRLHGAGVWVEVSTLFVPGMNDSPDEMRQIAKFIAELNADIPWHPNCAHPAYRMMDMPHDPLPLMEKAIDIGRAAGLHHIYTFERFESDEHRKTLCARCGEVLIERAWPAATANHLTASGDCPSCGAHCAGVWARPDAELRDQTRQAEPEQCLPADLEDGAAEG
jgi:pyruvate formate lyase activating enzyme